MASRSNESNNPATLCSYLPDGPLKDACKAIQTPSHVKPGKKKKKKKNADNG